MISCAIEIPLIEIIFIPNFAMEEGGWAPKITFLVSRNESQHKLKILYYNWAQFKHNWFHQVSLWRASVSPASFPYQGVGGIRNTIKNAHSTIELNWIIPIWLSLTESSQFEVQIQNRKVRETLPREILAQERKNQEWLFCFSRTSMLHKYVRSDIFKQFIVLIYIFDASTTWYSLV